MVPWLSEEASAAVGGGRRRGHTVPPAQLQRQPRPPQRRQHLPQRQCLMHTRAGVQLVCAGARLRVRDWGWWGEGAPGPQAGAVGAGPPPAYGPDTRETSLGANPHTCARTHCAPLHLPIPPPCPCTMRAPAGSATNTPSESAPTVEGVVVGVGAGPHVRHRHGLQAVQWVVEAGACAAAQECSGAEREGRSHVCVLLSLAVCVCGSAAVSRVASHGTQAVARGCWSSTGRTGWGEAMVPARSARPQAAGPPAGTWRPNCPTPGWFSLGWYLQPPVCLNAHLPTRPPTHPSC